MTGRGAQSADIGVVLEVDVRAVSTEKELGCDNHDDVVEKGEETAETSIR